MDQVPNSLTHEDLEISMSHFTSPSLDVTEGRFSEMSHTSGRGMNTELLKGILCLTDGLDVHQDVIKTSRGYHDYFLQDILIDFPEMMRG